MNTTENEICIHILKQNGIDVQLNISEVKEKEQKQFEKTKWPKEIKDFMLKQPISRLVPGSSVSIKYGVREQKYIRNYTVKESFEIFK